MEPKDFQVYYWAGIGVVAEKFGIKVERLSMGDEYGLNGMAALEPVEEWCELDVDYSTYKTKLLEEYVTTLLAGSAASFIRIRDRRCPFKRSLGDAGLEMKFLREVWQCFQREPDRAVAIICGSLGKRDDGDIEATTQRLWRRAVHMLQQPPQSSQLKTLARALLEKKQMTALEIHQTLRTSR